MGEFDERLRQKSALEEERLLSSVRDLAGAATGQTGPERSESGTLRIADVFREIGRYLHVSIPYSAGTAISPEWVREQVFRPRGIMWREVRLKDNWYENADGVMQGALADGRPVAFLPAGNGHYCYRDPETGKKRRIGRENAGSFDPKATLYYRALPSRKITPQDIRQFIIDSVSAPEIIRIAAAALLAMALGLVTPAMTRILLGNVTQTKDLHLLMVILAVLVTVTAAIFFITCIRQLLLAQMSTKVAVPLQAAFMMRVLTAQAGELRQFAAGDLGTRIGSMYGSLKNLLSMFLSMILTAACSLICFFQMFRYAPGPAGAAAAITAILILLIVRVIRKQVNVSRVRMENQAEEAGLTYSLIDGMQKITLSGAEKRAFAVWAGVYRKAVQTLYNPPLLLKIYQVLIPVILLAGTIVMYLTAAKTGVSPADFFAFTSSYGILTGALTVVSGSAGDFADALSSLSILAPVMDFVPESDEGRTVVQKLRGNISLRHVTFGYTKSAPPVLDDLNLEIRQGEYVALVGATGCGKSTVMRLMLGFEKPDHGDILYDGRNLNTLDLTSLRRKIGTVMQDGELFGGTILTNITISAPALPEADAWAAAEIAGIAEDIRSMPMQMNTYLPEGGRGVSGGQKQRILIARAVVSKPSVLIFDEATSALDNLTQKAVSDALGELPCTRIVIAHRLSTVQNCDRILVLEGGRIAEEGSFEELMSRNGRFAELVRRQQVG